jgi:hypothetical protein
MPNAFDLHELCVICTVDFNLRVYLNCIAPAFLVWAPGSVAKKIDASFNMALALRRSLFSRSSYLSRARSSDVAPRREPASIWLLRSQVLSVSGDIGEELLDGGEGSPLRTVVRSVVIDHPYGSFTQFGWVTGYFWHEVILSEDLLSNFPVAIQAPP